MERDSFQLIVMTLLEKKLIQIVFHTNLTYSLRNEMRIQLEEIVKA